MNKIFMQEVNSANPKMFVCFKGRIESLPDKWNPYLIAEFPKVLMRHNGLCSRSQKPRTPSTLVTNQT